MENLRIIRAKKEISQQTVADCIGINRVTYTNYENGNRDPDTDTLKRLADYFNVTTDYLLGRDGFYQQVTETKKTPSPPQLHEDESELLEVYRQLTKGSKKRMIGFGYDEIDRAKQEQAATTVINQNAG